MEQYCERGFKQNENKTFGMNYKLKKLYTKQNINAKLHMVKNKLDFV